MLVWITEDPKQESQTKDGGRFEAIRYFTAQFSKLTDGEAELFKKRPDLAPYGAHPRRPDALVIDCRMRFDKGGIPPLWKIEVEYSTEYEAMLDPLAAPAVITTGTVTRDEVALCDGEGNPILNTAGDLIDDPPCIRRRSDLVYHVTKNIPAGKLPDWVDDYLDTVNEDAVTILGRNREPETLLFQYQGTGDPQTVNGKSFMPLSFDLVYRKDNWRESIPNRGFYQLLDPKKTMTGPSVNGAPNDQTQIGKGKNARIRSRIMVREGNSPDGVMVPCPEAQMLDKNGLAIPRPTLQNVVTLTPLIPVKMAFSELPLK